jgi:hypothetical protein
MSNPPACLNQIVADLGNREESRHFKNLALAACHCLARVAVGRPPRRSKGVARDCKNFF